MSDNGGVFDQAKVINHFLKHFGDPSSPYQIALAKRKDKKYPIEGPWIQGAMMSMMDRFKVRGHPLMISDYLGPFLTYLPTCPHPILVY